MQQLWEHTVAALPSGCDLEAAVTDALGFFADLCQIKLIDATCLARHLTPDAPHQKAHAMTPHSLECLYKILLAVNIALHLIQPTPKTILPDGYEVEVVSGGKCLVGFDYLYDVLTTATDAAVARQAAEKLVEVYVQPYSGYGRCYASWHSCALAPHGLRYRTVVASSARCDAHGSPWRT